MSEITDPVEKVIADVLDKKKIKYLHELDNKGPAIDFYLPEYNLYVECKRYYTERSALQLKANDNIILIQGLDAAKSFALMLESLVVCP
jgi:hypothetical protein